MLLNSIFKQENHLCLKYKEKEIFGHKEDYFEYINDELKKFHNKEKDIKAKYFFSNSIKTRGYGKLDLVFKSLVCGTNINLSSLDSALSFLTDTLII